MFGLKQSSCHILILFSFILALALSISGCGRKSGRLVVFGDSISQGAHANDSYAKLLADFCRLTEENHSVSSTTLEDDAQIGAIKKTKILPGDRILFSPGINDAHIHKQDPKYLQTYEKLLEESLDRLENSGGMVFVGEPLLVLESGVSSSNSEELRELNRDTEAYVKILKQIIAKRGYQQVRLLETRSQFHPTLSLMRDAVHPNDEGHRELFSIFRKALGEYCSS